MMGWYGPQGDCGCCEDTPPGGCAILADDFNRDDSSDIGSDWEEVSGTWEILSNQLRGTGLALAVPERADATVDYTVSATVPFFGRIIFDADELGNYHYVSNEAFTVNFGNQSGVIANYSFSGANGPRPIKVCVTGGRLLINFLDNSTMRARARTFTPHGGLRAGVGSASTVNYDDFAYQRHGAPCDTCQGECSTACCDSTAAEYVVDVGTPGLTDDRCGTCESIAGEFSVEWEGNCQWAYRVTDWNCCEHPDSQTAWSVTLQLVSGCKWRVTFRVQTIENPDISEGNCGQLTVVYESEEIIDPTTCDSGTLPPFSKVSEFDGFACDGTWPSTITVRAA